MTDKEAKDTQAVVLADRGVLAVKGVDAVHFLDNLVTNDLSAVPEGEARFAALLSPQGKIQFETLALRTADGWLLDTDRARLADFAKRLTLYKLRAKVTFEDQSAAYLVAAQSATLNVGPAAAAGAFCFTDPRSPGLGQRLLIPVSAASRSSESPAARAPYDASRVRLCVPEGGFDYPFGDTFPHEANYDRLQGVSFTKGCFVGQEVVARMQNKTVVRKRVARVTGSGALSRGVEVKVGEATIGTIGTVAGHHALALLRLDRVVEAIDKGEIITAGGASMTVDAADLAAYRAQLAEKAALP